MHNWDLLVAVNTSLCTLHCHTSQPHILISLNFDTLSLLQNLYFIKGLSTSTSSYRGRTSSHYLKKRSLMETITKYIYIFRPQLYHQAQSRRCLISPHYIDTMCLAIVASTPYQQRSAQGACNWSPSTQRLGLVRPHFSYIVLGYIFLIKNNVFICSEKELPVPLIPSTYDCSLWVYILSFLLFWHQSPWAIFWWWQTFQVTN